MRFLIDCQRCSDSWTREASTAASACWLLMASLCITPTRSSSMHQRYRPSSQTCGLLVTPPISSFAAHERRLQWHPLHGCVPSQTAAQPESHHNPTPSFHKAERCSHTDPQSNLFGSDQKVGFFFPCTLFCSELRAGNGESPWSKNSCRRGKHSQAALLASS